MNVLSVFINLNPSRIPIFSSFSPYIKKHYLVYIYGKVKNEWKKNIKFIPFHPDQIFPSTLINWFASLPKFYQIVEDLNIDLVFNRAGLVPNLYNNYIKKKKNIPHVIYVAGEWGLARSLMESNILKQKLYNYIEGHFFKQSDLVIPVSSQIREFCLYKWNIKKVTKPCLIGIDIHHFRYHYKKNDKFTIGYAGRISPEKGVSRLVKIMKRLPNIQFKIAGRKQINIDFPSNCKYLGEISFNDMPNFYNSVDCIILPSYTEGFPRVALEAYACNTPIIISDEACPHELKVYGIKCDSSIGSYISAIKTLKKSNLKQLGKQARKYSLNFDWRHFGEKILLAFHEVLE